MEEKSPFIPTQLIQKTVQTDIGPVRIEYRKRTQKIRVEAVLLATEHYRALTGKEGYTVAVYQDECAKRMLQEWSLKPFGPRDGWALLDPDTNVREEILTAMGVRSASVEPDQNAKNSQPGEGPQTPSPNSTLTTGSP